MAGAAVETTANHRSCIRFKVLNLRIRWESTWKSEWLKTTNWIALRGVRVEIAFLGTLSICTQKYWFRKTATLRSMLKSVSLGGGRADTGQQPAFAAKTEEIDRAGATISRSRALVRGCCAFAL